MDAEAVASPVVGGSPGLPAIPERRRWLARRSGRPVWRVAPAFAVLALFLSSCRPAPADQLAQATRPPTVTADPWAAKGRPLRLRIQAIGVDAEIESLALTSDQKIAVPTAWERVGWYREGYRPGEKGRAVLSGHFDDDQGRPAVFSRLADLRPGDRIELDYADGSSMEFVAGDQRLVDVAAVDAATWEAIFGASEQPMLSLITCDGVWDAALGTYSLRRVVFAEER